jgi:hypothetical protein
MDPEKIRESRLAEVERRLADADTDQKRSILKLFQFKILKLDDNELIQAETQIRQLDGGVNYGKS